MHWEEAIPPPPPLHREGSIIIEGGQSVWRSDGVEVRERWMEVGASVHISLYL